MKRSVVACAVLVGLASLAEAAEKLVRVSPIKGVVIGVPKGWKACDLYFDQKLGKPDDPHALSKDVCSGAYGKALKLAAFSPASPKLSKLYVLYINISPTSSQAIRGLTPDMVRSVSQEICTEWKKSAARDKTSLDSCAVRTDTLDGKPALVTAVSQTPKQGSQGQFVTEVWEVPYDQGFVQFTFRWSNSEDSARTFARIKSSIGLD